MNVFIMDGSIVKPFGRGVQNNLIGYAGEHGSRTLAIRTMDDISDYTVISLIIDTVDCGSMTRTRMPDGSTMLSLVLTSDMMQMEGNRICQLVMTDGEKIMKSSQFCAYVSKSNNIEDALPDGATLTIINSIISQLIDDAVASITVAGTQVRESIPSNYTLLSDEVSHIREELNTQADVDAYTIASQYNLYPNKHDAIQYSNWTKIERRGNYIILDGENTSNMLRFAIFNDSNSKVSSTSPSYANRPAWYSPISTFTVGHVYRFGVRLISGSYTWIGTSALDTFIDVRTQADGVLYQSKNSEWTCDKTPEMICFTIGKGVYQNAVFELSVIDVTEFEAGDPTELKLSAINDKIETLQGVTDDIENALDSTTVQISHATKDSTAPKLSLLFYTDIHANAGAIDAINAYVTAHEDVIDDVICGGDTAQYEYSSSKNQYYFDSGLANKSLAVIGNHDVAAYDSNNNISWWAHTQKEAYDKYIAPYVSGWNVIQPTNAASIGLNYYYKDYTLKDNSIIRIIYLDAMFWDTSQHDWLVVTLTSARTSGMSVMIVAHGTDGKFTGDLNCNWTWVEKPNENGFYSNLRFDGTAASAVNDFIMAGGEFVGWLVGHSHLDRIGYMTDYPTQPVFNMNNAGTKTANARAAVYSCTMVVIDRINKLVKLVRAGCNYDAYLKPKHTLCYNYETRTIISQT